MAENITMTTVNNNKRIAKNTMMLYIRMILVMGITLFTSRIILDALGEENYGIYNVVGGVVAMFGFFSSTLASSCQRYFSYYIGKDDKKELSKVFRLNMSVFILLALVVLFIAETIGLWFINTKLNIEESRIFAMNCVYQCSLLSFFCSIVLVPYNALIISYEKMSAFAYISIVEVLLKLLLAILLTYLLFDKLILYAVMMLFCQVIITLYYYIYCQRNIAESKYAFYWEKDRFKEILSYSGWHLIGALSVIVKNQGVNILINTFYNPIVNAGRAIAFQVTTATDSLSNNFFVAAKPQIYKYYAQKDYEELHKLILRSSKVCFLLILIIAIPLLINTSAILSLWLKNVPSYAILFTQLALINAVIDSMNGPAIASALATANIKKFELITGSLMILNLPVSYIVLKMGAIPEMTIIVSIVISLVTIIVRAFILKELIHLSVIEYIQKTFLPLMFVGIISGILSYGISIFFKDGLFRIMVTSIISVCIIVIFFYIICLSKSEKIAISNFIKNKIKK